MPALSWVTQPLLTLMETPKLFCLIFINITVVTVVVVRK
jgi:hypothetical protein